MGGSIPTEELTLDKLLAELAALNAQEESIESDAETSDEGSETPETYFFNTLGSGAVSLPLKKQFCQHLIQNGDLEDRAHWLFLLSRAMDHAPERFEGLLQNDQKEKLEWFGLQPALELWLPFLNEIFNEVREADNTLAVHLQNSSLFDKSNFSLLDNLLDPAVSAPALEWFTPALDQRWDNGSDHTQWVMHQLLMLRSWYLADSPGDIDRMIGRLVAVPADTLQWIADQDETTALQLICHFIAAIAYLNESPQKSKQLNMMKEKGMAVITDQRLCELAPMLLGESSESQVAESIQKSFSFSAPDLSSNLSDEPQSINGLSRKEHEILKAWYQEVQARLEKSASENDISSVSPTVSAPVSGAAPWSVSPGAPMAASTPQVADVVLGKKTLEEQFKEAFPKTLVLLGKRKQVRDDFVAALVATELTDEPLRTLLSLLREAGGGKANANQLKEGDRVWGENELLILEQAAQRLGLKGEEIDSSTKYQQLKKTLIAFVDYPQNLRVVKAEETRALVVLESSNASEEKNLKEKQQRYYQKKMFELGLKSPELPLWASFLTVTESAAVWPPEYFDSDVKPFPLHEVFSEYLSGLKRYEQEDAMWRELNRQQPKASGAQQLPVQTSRRRSPHSPGGMRPEAGTLAADIQHSVRQDAIRREKNPPKKILPTGKTWLEKSMRNYMGASSLDELLVLWKDFLAPGKLIAKFFCLQRNPFMRLLAKIPVLGRFISKRSATWSRLVGVLKENILTRVSAQAKSVIDNPSEGIAPAGAEKPAARIEVQNLSHDQRKACEKILKVHPSRLHWPGEETTAMKEFSALFSR